MSTTKRIKQEKQKGVSKADETADSLSGDAKDKKQVNIRHSNTNRSSQHSTKSDTNKPINPNTERSSQSERDAIRERLKNRKKDITDTDSLPSPNQKSDVHTNNNSKKRKKVSKDSKDKSNDPPPLDLPKVSLNVIQKINQRQQKNETDSTTITNPPQTKLKSKPKIKSKSKKVKTANKPKPNSNQQGKTDEILQKPKKRPYLIQKSINKNDDSNLNSSLNSTKIDEDKLILDKSTNNSRNSVRKPVHTKKNPNTNLPDKSNENVSSSSQQTKQKVEEESSSTPPKPTYRLSRNKLPQIPSDEDERIDSTSDEEPVIIPPSVDKPSTPIQPEVPQIDNQETVKSVDNNNDNQLSNNIDNNQTTTLHSNPGNITQTLSSNPNINTQSSNSNTNNATTTLNSNTTNSKPENISSIVDDNFVKNVKEQFSESSSQQPILNESKPLDDIKASIEKVVQSSESLGEEEEEEEASDEEEEEEEEAESNEYMSTDQDNKSDAHSHKSGAHSHRSDAHSHRSDAHSNKNSARENSGDSNPKKISPIQEKHKSAENKQDTLSLTDIFKEVSIHSDDKNDDEPKRRRKSDPFLQMKDVNQVSSGGNKNEKNNQQFIEENRPLRNQSMRIKKKATTTNNIPLAFPHFNPKPVSFRFPSYNKNQFPINDDEFHDFEPTSKRKPDLSPPINFQIQIIPNPPIIDINSELAQYDRVKLLQEIKKQ